MNAARVALSLQFAKGQRDRKTCKKFEFVGRQEKAVKKSGQSHSQNRFFIKFFKHDAHILASLYDEQKHHKACPYTYCLLKLAATKQRCITLADWTSSPQVVSWLWPMGNAAGKVLL